MNNMTWILAVDWCVDQPISAVDEGIDELPDISSRWGIDKLPAISSRLGVNKWVSVNCLQSEAGWVGEVWESSH